MSTNIHGKSHPLARSLRLCSKGNGGIYGKTAQAKKRREYTISKPPHTPTMILQKHNRTGKIIA